MILRKCQSSPFKSTPITGSRETPMSHFNSRPAPAQNSLILLGSTSRILGKRFPWIPRTNSSLLSSKSRFRCPVYYYFRRVFHWSFSLSSISLYSSTLSWRKAIKLLVLRTRGMLWKNYYFLSNFSMMFGLFLTGQSLFSFESLTKVDWVLGIPRSPLCQGRISLFGWFLHSIGEDSAGRWD